MALEEDGRLNVRVGGGGQHAGYGTMGGDDPSPRPRQASCGGEAGIAFSAEAVRETPLIRGWNGLAFVSVCVLIAVLTHTGGSIEGFISNAIGGGDAAAATSNTSSDGAPALPTPPQAPTGVEQPQPQPQQQQQQPPQPPLALAPTLPGGGVVGEPPAPAGGGGGGGGAAAGGVEAGSVRIRDAKHRTLPHQQVVSMRLVPVGTHRQRNARLIRKIKANEYFPYHNVLPHVRGNTTVMLRNSKELMRAWTWEDWVERILFGAPMDDGRRLTGRGLHNSGNTEFLAVVDLGTPPRRHELIVDTGSSNTWVAGSMCKMRGCSNMHLFSPSASESWEPIPEGGSRGDGTFQLTYGTGSCAGFLGRDILDFGATNTTHPIGVATTVAPFFENVPFADGILGLGMQSLSDGDLPTVLDSLFAGNRISRRVMAMYLASEGEQAASQMTFGGPNIEMYRAPLQYVPLVPLRGRYLYFIIQFDGFWVGGKRVRTRCTTDCRAVIDSGTSLLLGPPVDITRINSRLGVQGCRPPKDLQIGIGGVRYTLPSSLLLLSDGAECVPSVLSDTMMPDLFIFGDTFFRAIYTVFDIDSLKLGVAAHSNMPVPEGLTQPPAH